MRTVLRYVKNYKKVSFLTILFTVLEVFMEVLLPFVTSYIIDKGIEAGNINNVYKFGGLMPVSYTHLDVYKRQALPQMSSKMLS